MAQPNLPAVTAIVVAAVYSQPIYLFIDLYKVRIILRL